VPERDPLLGFVAQATITSTAQLMEAEHGIIQIVYGFGFLFLPAKDGLREMHMNQGNPPGRHRRETGPLGTVWVLVQRGDNFIALFTAFQTRYFQPIREGFQSGMPFHCPSLW
jgi:uncharacterized protein YukJ